MILHIFRDCPGVGTSTGPNGKEVSYHGNVGGSSVGYKPPPQHSPQSRGPPTHFPQESVGPPANSPPLHINICGQVSIPPSILSVCINLCVLFFLKDICTRRRTRCAVHYWTWVQVSELAMLIWSIVGVPKVCYNFYIAL